MTRTRALAWLAALAACLAPAAVRADPRTDARRHFRAGMAEIARGEFDAGVAELKRAYDIKPHPNVLYNIAKAYEDAAGARQGAERERYALLAVDYYTRYLAYDVADRDKVQGALAQLKSELKPKAAPAPVPAPQPERKTAQLAGEEKRLADLLDRLDKAVARAEGVAEGQGEEQAAPAPAPTPAEKEKEFDATVANSNELYEEVVVTASRRSQSALEAPGAVTVITDDDIRLSGATDIPDLLRRVPGIDVMAMGASSFNVSMRGFDQRLANKVLVLVDGRSVYQDFLGFTLWEAIPLSLQEVKRIEVVRGPGSTLYGANAFLGVVNIITKTPAEMQGLTAMAGGGTGQVVQGALIGAGRSGKLGYRTAAGYDRADKFSLDFDPARRDVVSTATDPNLSMRVGRADAEVAYDLGEGRRAVAQGGYSRDDLEIYPIGLLRNYQLQGDSMYARGELPMGPVKLTAFWDRLQADSGPQFWPAGARSLATRVATNVADVEAQYDASFTLAGQHAFTAGVGYRYKDVAWTYLPGFRAENHFSFYAQEEYRPVPEVRLVGGYRIDRHPLLDGGQPGYAQSPRLSAIWLFRSNQALHATAASSFRVPTFLESYVRVATPVPTVNGVSVLTEGNRALKPEQLNAVELGWRSELDRVTTDVALYDQRISDLIVLSAIDPLGYGGTWDPSSGSYLLGRSQFVNDPTTYNALGAELGTTVTPVDRLDLRANAALERVDVVGRIAGACVPCHSSPGYKLYGGATYRSRLGVDFEAGAQWVSRTSWFEREPDPADPEAVAFVRNPLAAYLVGTARIGWRAVPDELELALVGTNLGPTHREHPFGNLIAPRLLATVWARY